MNKDNIIGFLVELNEMIESEKYLLPTDIYDETNKCIKRNVIVDWKVKIDEATADLSMRWLQEEVSLETCIKQWSSMYYDEFEFTEAIGKIAKIVEGWKKSLTDVLYKDPSIYTMPKESAENESDAVGNNDSLQEDSSISSEGAEKEREDAEEVEGVEQGDEEDKLEEKEVREIIEAEQNELD